MQDTDDQVIDRLMAAGATDDEIVEILRERKSRKTVAPVAQPPVKVTAKKEESLQDIATGALSGAGEMLRGFGKGVKEGVQNVANTVGEFSPLPNLAAMTQGKKKATPLFDTKKRTPSKEGAEAAGEFFGSMVPGLAISIPTSGVVNPVLGPLGTKMLGSTARFVTPKFVKSVAVKEAINAGITTLPQELVAGAISEALINPEAFKDVKSALRTGAMSSIGSIINMGFAYKGAILNAKTAPEVESIRAQLKELGDDISDVGRTAPNVPEVQAGLVEAADRTMPTAAQVAAGRAQKDFVPNSGRLPTAREKAWTRTWDALEEEAQKRIEALKDIKPKTKVDPLVKAASKQEVDPLIQAQVRGVEERLSEVIQLRGAGGKGVQTAPGVDLGVTTTPNMFLTLDELNDHLRILNMATTQSNPAFKPGQRFVIPRTELKTAEEIAGRATGGPIKAIDKTIQKGMKDVQKRLDIAAAQNLKMLDPGEEADIVNELMSMSRRLSRGFEVPRKANTPLGGADPSASRRAFGEDLSTSAALGEPDLPTRIQDDNYKRWVTGSDNVPTTTPDVPAPPAPPMPPIIGQQIADLYAGGVRDMNIDYTPKNQNIFQRIGDRLVNAKTEFYDRTWGVGKYSENTRDALSLMSGTAKAADEFYENQMSIAVRDINDPKKITFMPVQGRTLGQMIDGLALDEVKEMDALLKARTILSSTAKNPKFISDVPLPTAQAVAANASDKIKKLADEFKIVSDALVDDAIASGRISAARGAEMKESFYAGLSRSFNNQTTQNVLAKRVGSKRASLSPVMLMRDNIFKTLEVNRQNIAYNRLIDDFESNPAKYTGVLEPAQVNLDNIPGYRATVKDLQDNAGMSLKDAEDLAALNQGSLDLSDGSMVVYRDGRPTFWKVNGDIKRTMDSMKPLEFGAFRSLLNAVSAPTRIAVSTGLDLSLIGPVSDAFLTAAKVPEFNILTDPIRGFWHSATRSPEYFERVAAGGAYSGRFEPSEVVVFKSDAATVIGKAGKGLAHPLKMLQKFIRPLSDASRMGEYLVRRNKLGQDAITAALGSRRTLGDFNRHGASLRAWALVTEFGNVGIQTAGAAAQLGRDALKSPAAFARMQAVGFGAITLPTVYFWAAAQGDDELNAKRKSDVGYRHWWFRGPGGEIIKYPKIGWWMGQVYGSSVEAMLDGFDKDAQKRLADGVLSQVGLNTMPLKLQQMFGMMTNTRNPLSLGPDIPITPQNQVNLDPVVQGNERTSPLARTLADNVGINPFKTDFVLESIGGNLFSSIVRNIGTSDVDYQKTDLPVVGRFFTKPGAATEGQSMFYRDIREAQKADNSYEKALKSGDVDKARKVMEEYSEVIGKKKILESLGARISEMNATVQTFTMDPMISPEDKREYINNIRKVQEEYFAEYAKIGLVKR